MEPELDYIIIDQHGISYDKLKVSLEDDPTVTTPIRPEAALIVGANEVCKKPNQTIDLTIAFLFTKLNKKLEFLYPPLSVSGVFSCFQLFYQFYAESGVCSMTCQRFLPTYNFDNSLGYTSTFRLTSLSQYNSNVHPVSYGDILGYLDNNVSGIPISYVIEAISSQLSHPIYNAILDVGAGEIASSLLTRQIIEHSELRFLLGKCLAQVIESVRNPQPTPIRRPKPRLRCRSRSDNR